MGVNALRRATLISTPENWDEYAESFLCQCPKTGNSHFHEKGFYVNSWGEMCQCPKTGNSHFHIVTKLIHLPRIPVSMP